MFKLLNPVAYGITGDPVLGELYATTKEEVVVGATIEGLPAGRSLASGSWGFTHHGDLFIYDETNGFWFVGDEEDSSAKTLNTTLGKTLLGGVKPSVEPSVEEEAEEEPIIEEEEPEIEEKAVKE